MSDLKNSLEESPSWASIGTHCLDRAPRYLIFFLIFYAPFCYGLRDGAGESMFVTVAFAAFFIFCWKCYLDGRWPRVPAWMLFCMTFIALQGLWMCLNADSYYRWHRELITVRILETAPFPDLPGSRDRLASPIQFFPQLAVFCLILIIIELSTSHRRQIITAAAICAVVFAITGITLKIGGAEMVSLYWEGEDPGKYATTFAGYRYHGNAATFLTIGFALVMGILLQAHFEQRSRGTRTIASTGATLIVSALFLNTSRAGWGLTLVVMTLFAPRVISRLFEDEDSSVIDRAKKLVPAFLGLIMAMVAVVALFSAESTFRVGRLTMIAGSMANRFPLELFLQILPDTPLAGFGPGTFSLVFPKYQLANPGMFPLNTYLNEAHQDYFQLFFDWGLAGFICWMAILLIPVVGFVRHRFDGPDPQLTYACFTAMFAALIHATMDFPLQVTSILFYVGITLACLTDTVSPSNKNALPDINGQGAGWKQ